MFYYLKHSSNIVKNLKSSEDIYFILFIFLFISLFIILFIIFKKIKNKINNDKYIFYKKNDSEYNYSNSLNFSNDSKINNKHKNDLDNRDKNIIKLKDIINIVDIKTLDNIDDNRDKNSLSEYEKYNLYMNKTKITHEYLINKNIISSELDKIELDNITKEKVDFISDKINNISYILTYNDYYYDNYDKYLKKDQIIYIFNKYIDEDNEDISPGLKYKIDEHGNVLYLNRYIGAPIIPRKYGYTSKKFCEKLNCIDNKLLLDTLYKIKLILLNYYNDNFSQGENNKLLKITKNNDTSTIINIINKYKEQTFNDYNFSEDLKNNLTSDNLFIKIDSNLNVKNSILEDYSEGNFNKDLVLYITDCYQLLIIIDIILYSYINNTKILDKHKFKTEFELLNYKLNIYANKIIFENRIYTYTQNKHFLLLIQLIYNELRLFFSY